MAVAAPTEPLAVVAASTVEPAPSRLERISIFLTAGLAALAALVAWWSYGTSPFLLALSLGSLGGLIHEFAQSGGKILFFERKLDGMYIGSIAGMVLGSVSAVAVARGMLAPAGTEPFTVVQYQNLAFESFFAAIGMKGIVEAATGSPLPPGQQEVAPAQTAMIEQQLRGGLGSGRATPLSGLPPRPDRIDGP
jgi:hypothetical protein